MTSSSPARFLGLISGTSADAVDAAVVSFDGGAEVLAARSYPLPVALRDRLLDLGGGFTPAELTRLDARLGEVFADAALALLDEAGVAADSITAIGSHGQTLWHAADDEPASTWQIGDPNRIAERTGIATVADFRRRDMAAGGQGAPLAPAFHDAVFSDPTELRGILNLGGIANLTLLPRAGSGEVLGFDTGPANTLLDAWCREHRNESFDADGAWARSGTCDDGLLQAWLDDPYFQRPPPKSTGPEHFNLAWLAQRAPGLDALDAASVQATLLELTARSATAWLDHWGERPGELLVCGGGVHNGALMARIAALVPDVRVQSTAVRGVDPDYVEAAAFAWLARQTLAGEAGNLPSVTGARGPRVLGAVYPGGRDWDARSRPWATPTD